MKVRRRTTLVLWLIAAAAAAGALTLSQRQPSPVHSSGLPVLGRVADFKLTERTGRTVTLGDLQGQVWIAGFVFTRCSGPCPLMSNRMSQLQGRLADVNRVKLVSFTVDPEYDTPHVLTEYAARYKADAGRWWFLTGDRTAIHNLAIQHFYLGISEIPPAEREAADQAIRHSTKFVLVDGAGQIRGYYSSEDEFALDGLARDARKLTGEI